MALVGTLDLRHGVAFLVRPSSGDAFNAASADRIQRAMKLSFERLCRLLREEFDSAPSPAPRIRACAIATP